MKMLTTLVLAYPPTQASLPNEVNKDEKRVVSPGILNSSASCQHWLGESTHYGKCNKSKTPKC